MKGLLFFKLTKHITSLVFGNKVSLKTRIIFQFLRLKVEVDDWYKEKHGK
ncbi:hypothetical protein OCHUTO_0669 [Orientia chuto str. Dubai]|uniref:Uncharacterized protein n=1 Tax=Orientia chuto str. Dubai TaxID=1359168 RepID=A0A0F3MJK6_9RICK|nr:hypothetical protein OCHUTO_0669 [Orientia chuto str. Dubai]